MSALDWSLREFLDEVAAATPSSTGGSVAAASLSAAAGLVAMAASVSTALSDGDEVARRAETARAEAMTLVDGDTQAYQEVLRAMRRPQHDPQRAGAVRESLAAAARPPSRLARLASDIAELARHVATYAKPSTAADAAVAATIAAAAGRSAAYLVRTNLVAAGVELGEADRADDAASSAGRCAAMATGARE